MDFDLLMLASAAVAIRVYLADDPGALGSGLQSEPDIEPDEALLAIRDLVDELAGLDATTAEAVVAIRDDEHARAHLQRHLHHWLRAEPAYRHELLRFLTEAGRVVPADGVTMIFIADPPVTIELRWSSAECDRITAPSAAHVGRDTELGETLRRMERRNGHPVVLMVTGAPGTGRTDFARELADRAHRGGSSRTQVEVRLTTPAPALPGRRDRRPTTEAQAEVLMALGVPAGDIPAAAEERHERYRSELRDRRPLLLLDDAWDALQVQALTPPGDGAVLITCTDPIPDLGYGLSLGLGPLTEEQSVLALADRAGVDLSDAPDAARAREVARLCSGVPLALALMAGRLATATGSQAEQLTRRFTAALHGHDDTVRPVNAALHATYSMLEENERRILYVAALLGAPAYDGRLLSVASGVPEATTQDVLSRLAGLALMETLGRTGDRWRLHPLVASFAYQAAPRRLREDRDTITGLAAQLYLRRLRSLLGLLRSPGVGSDPSIEAWARTQADTMRESLSAALRASTGSALAGLAGEFADGLVHFVRLTRRTDAGSVLEQAIEVARAERDRGLEGRVLRLLAENARERGERGPADALDARASELHREPDEHGARGEGTDGEPLQTEGIGDMEPGAARVSEPGNAAAGGRARRASADGVGESTPRGAASGGSAGGFRPAGGSGVRRRTGGGGSSRGGRTSGRSTGWGGGARRAAASGSGAVGGAASVGRPGAAARKAGGADAAPQKVTVFGNRAAS
ncbi:hypothetical protein [Actinomadura sp. DC4]|uniref:hypothetical protein n=1 Tax=Actinomadura sp. DC4 TaxID=3055069 RepID=UPI0025AF1026|nr:hypothetical protein [Actinomadura sp. DC4]MDN3357642.1 hypothetical protein [Actinomadura sp. DC4]